MELLLWMWFYDPRWFFNIKLTIKCYKFTWLIPLLAHLGLVAYCIYLEVYYDTMDNLSKTLNETVIPWVLSRIFFSLLIAITIIIFMFKISMVYKRELQYFKNAENIYPQLKDNMEPYNFWIRRKSLISTPGILLLFLGFVSLFWSYIMIKLYHFDKIFEKDKEFPLIAILNVYNIFIFVGNIPLMVLFFFMVFLKIIYFLSAFLCPKVLIWISKKTSSFSKSRKINHLNNSISY